MLETPSTAVIIPALPDDKDLPTKGFKPSEVLSAIRGIRSTEPESTWVSRQTRSEREAESLARWADERGVLSTRNLAPKADELTGGEHFVTLNEPSGLVFKTTLPGKFGFAVDMEMVRPKGRKEKPRITASLSDATPEEYILRMGWQNGIFNDDVKFVGAVRYPQGISILTTQPFYTGDRTAQPIIDTWFSDRGWKPMVHRDGAFYNKELDLMIMDALPRNVLTLKSGEVMPFDVVIVKPDEMLKARFGL